MWNEFLHCLVQIFSFVSFSFSFRITARKVAKRCMFECRCIAPKTQPFKSNNINPCIQRVFITLVLPISKFQCVNLEKHSIFGTTDFSSFSNLKLHKTRRNRYLVQSFFPTAFFSLVFVIGCHCCYVVLDMLCCRMRTLVSIVELGVRWLLFVVVGC